MREGVGEGGGELQWGGGGATARWMAIVGAQQWGCLQPLRTALHTKV